MVKQIYYWAFYVNEHIPLTNSYVRGVPEPFDHSSAMGGKKT